MSYGANRGHLLAATAIALGAYPSTAAAAPGDIRNLGTVSGGTSSQARAINNAGQVTGFSAVGGIDHAFLYGGTPGTMADLGTRGLPAVGLGINDAGQVVGRDGTAFLYRGTPGAGGSVVNLGSNWTTANDINDAGQMVGTVIIPGTDAVFHASLYTGTPGSGGRSFDLGALGAPFHSSHAYGINNLGQVTGESYTFDGPRAFLYSGTPGAGGAMVSLGTLGGRSEGHAINDAGQVTGLSYLNFALSHAFRYTGTPGAGGAMVDLGTLGEAPSTYSAGWDIDKNGIVVGYAGDNASNVSRRAVLWQNDAASTIVNLDEWLDVTNPTLGAHWLLFEAYGINDSGLIAGSGVYDDGPGGLSDGIRAFTLDASSLVPEPSGLAILAVAAGSLLRRGRRSRGRAEKARPHPPATPA